MRSARTRGASGASLASSVICPRPHRLASQRDDISITSLMLNAEGSATPLLKSTRIPCNHIAGALASLRDVRDGALDLTQRRRLRTKQGSAGLRVGDHGRERLVDLMSDRRSSSPIVVNRVTSASSACAFNSASAACLRPVTSMMAPMKSKSRKPVNGKATNRPHVLDRAIPKSQAIFVLEVRAFARELTDRVRSGRDRRGERCLQPSEAWGRRPE